MHMSTPSLHCVLRASGTSSRSHRRSTENVSKVVNNFKEFDLLSFEHKRYNVYMFLDFYYEIKAAKSGAWAVVY